MCTCNFDPYQFAFCDNTRKEPTITMTRDNKEPLDEDNHDYEAIPPLVFQIPPKDNLADILISQIVQMEDRKPVIVKEKLKESGIDIDWKLEETRRFKSILVESHVDSGHEIYYYNDGSAEGLRIVTFVRTQSKDTGINISDTGAIFSMGYEYF